MHKERKLKALRRCLGDEAFTKGDEAIFTCPRAKCRKDRAKLSVNILRDTFHCWICNWGGQTLVPLLRLRGNTSDLKDYIAELEQRPGRYLVVDAPAREYDVPVLPDGFKTLLDESRSPYYRRAMEYLASRGVGTDDIVRYKMGYTEDGLYKYRIIFPSFDESGELNFWEGRSFFGDQVSYKHGNYSKDIVFNEYLVDWSHPVTIVEGPFDMLKAGTNAIPLLGLTIREDSRLFERIVVSNSDVYFALDSDAMKRQSEIIERFLSYGIRSYRVDLAGRKDPGEMTKEEFMTRKEMAREIRSDIDLLRMRVMA